MLSLGFNGCLKHFLKPWDIKVAQWEKVLVLEAWWMEALNPQWKEKSGSQKLSPDLHIRALAHRHTMIKATQNFKSSHLLSLSHCSQDILHVFGVLKMHRWRRREVCLERQIFTRPYSGNSALWLSETSFYYVLLMCTCVRACVRMRTWAWAQLPMEGRRGHQAPWSKSYSTGSCMPPDVCAGTRMWVLGEQQVLLTDEPSLHNRCSLLMLFLFSSSFRSRLNHLVISVVSCTYFHEWVLFLLSLLLQNSTVLFLFSAA